MRSDHFLPKRMFMVKRKTIFIRINSNPTYRKVTEEPEEAEVENEMWKKNKKKPMKNYTQTQTNFISIDFQI